jgi:competence protein ComEC
VLLRRLKIIISAIDVISVVFLLLLLFDPYFIYHIGFQFSFIVTFGIILSRKWLASVSSPGFQLLIISFISQMVILPLQLNYFSLFQPLSILLNLAVVPYFSVFVIPFMFLLLLFSFLPGSILHGFDAIFVAVHRQVISWIQWVDQFFDYPLYVSGLPGWIFILYYLFLLAALYFLEQKRLSEGFFSFVLLTTVLFGYASLPYFSDEGRVTMLDIGQGDAFILELPYRKGTIMIDAGARFSFEDMEASPSVYQRIIRPYLRANGIHEIDVLFLTHEDTDHIGSAAFMIEDGIVNELAVSSFFEVPQELEGDLPVYRIQAGEVLQIEDQLFTALAPVSDKQAANENSLVLYTELGGITWLFTGDIGVEEEKEIIQQYNLQADVLKVAHHGSSTSTSRELLDTINSRTALISVGKNNSYGHPTQEVIKTLEERGLEIFRTDQHGAVQYIFRGDEGEFIPYLTE